MNLLVLIIGGNNIANYALIKYFKEEGINNVALVYSEGNRGTKSKAEIIKNSLSNTINFIDINIGKESGCLDCVYNNVMDILNNYDIKYIHLDYTGGTKAMSLGTFLAVQDFSNQKNIKSVYTYVESFKLVYKNGDKFPKDDTLLKDLINTNLYEIITLHEHNIVSKHDKVSEFYSEKFVYFLIDKIVNDVDNFYYNLWEIDGTGDKVDKLLNLNWKESLLDDIGFDKNLGKKKLMKLKKFISGGFLEEYIFSVLSELKDELNISDILYGVNIKNKEGRNFELDVLVSKGYDLYTISCTTDNSQKSLNKSKLFEVAKRSKEIGGREAKFILATLMSENEKNFKDLQMELTNESKDYDLIGLETIKNKSKLKEKLKEIIK